MKILEIIADGSPGGGTTHVLQLLAALRSEYSMALMTQSNSYLFNKSRENSVLTYGMDFFARRFNLGAVLQLRKIVQDFSPNVIHLHGARAGFYYPLSCLDAPAIYTAHGYHFGQKQLIEKQLAILAERAINKSVSHVVFVSNQDWSISQKYQLMPGSRNSSVIHNGIPINTIPRAKSRPKTIGFIGRLESIKDPMLFLEVARLLPEYSALVVGGGELERFLTDKIHQLGLKNVQLTGSLSHTETLHVLGSLSAILLTSRWEGLPYLPLEAMCAGVPVIASDVGGMNEIIEHRISGVLIGSREPGEYKEAILFLENYPLVRKQIIQEARNRVESMFSEHAMLDAIRNLYEKTAFP